MTTLRVCAWQTDGAMGDPERNLTRLREVAQRARAQDAELLITPEMFVSGYDIERSALDALAGFDFEGRVAAIAREVGMAVLAGVPFFTEDGITNSSILVDRDGSTVLRHNKFQLYGDLDRELFVAGDRRASVAEFRGVRIATMICYDVEFPETVRAAALAGAHAVLVPTALMSPYEFVTSHVIPVRAFENGVYVAYVDRVGAELNTAYIGGSSICSPRGNVLAAAGPDEEALLFAELDTDEVDAVQREMPYLLDLRQSGSSASHSS